MATIDTSLYKINPRAFSILSAAYYKMPEIAIKAIDALGSPKEAQYNNQLILVGQLWEQIMSMIVLNNDGDAIIALTGDVDLINTMLECLKDAAGLTTFSNFSIPFGDIENQTKALTLSPGALWYGDPMSKPVELPPGPDGYILTMQAGYPVWQANTGAVQADNGLRIESGKVYLGGMLVEPTYISGDALYSLEFNFLSGFKAITDTSGGIDIRDGGQHYFQNFGNNIFIETTGSFAGIYLDADTDGGINMAAGSASLGIVGNKVVGSALAEIDLTSQGPMNLTSASFLLNTVTGDIQVPSGQLQLNSVYANPSLLYESMWGADMSWHVPNTLWGGSGGGDWAGIYANDDVYSYNGTYMVYGHSPITGNAHGFSFAVNTSGDPYVTFFLNSGGTNPDEFGVAMNTFHSLPIQLRADGQIRLWSNTGIDLAGSKAGGVSPIITLAGIPATNPTDYIGGDGQWHTAGGGGVTADNGITLSGSNLQLGGPLIKYTVVDGNAGTWGFDFDQVSAFNVYAPDGSFIALTNGGGINIASTNSIDFSFAGGGNPIFSLNGVTAANATDYIGGDGQWHVAPGGGGGSYTSNNGLTLTGSNFQLGGPLVQNTLINGAGFNMIWGTFLTSPINAFQVYGTTFQFNSRNAGTGAQSSYQMNSNLHAFTLTGAGNFLIGGGTSTAYGTTVAPLLTLTRRTSVLNAASVYISHEAQSSGNTTAGFGVYEQWQLYNGSATSAIAQQEFLTWQVTTAGGEYAQFRKSLIRAGGLTDVYTVVTNPDILHTFFGSVQIADAAGKIGFFTVTPVAKQTNGSNITNNMIPSGTTAQLDNWTDLTDYSTDAVAIHATVSQMATKLKIINDSLRLYGLFT